MSARSDLGFSVYCASFARDRDRLASLWRRGARVFTSLHISEENGASYVRTAEEMCCFLHETGYEIIADVSRRTLEMFGETDIVRLARRLHIDVLRFDYGFSAQEMARIGEQMPVCINASVFNEGDVALIVRNSSKVYALHNFYPRPETGLDEQFFAANNARLRELGVTPWAFIPGDCNLRAPLHEGLPTLEAHRGVSPWACFNDMVQHYGMEQVFVGDGLISDMEMKFFDDCRNDGIIDVPVVFNGGDQGLNGAVFTVRADSPHRVMRMQESREYSCCGKEIAPASCTERVRGSVTIDNINYKRYSGEIQIVRDTLPADNRVNVIGRIPEKYLLLLDSIPNNARIRLISEIQR